MAVYPLKDGALVQMAYPEDVFAETVDFLNREKAAFTTKSDERIRFKVHLQQLKNNQGAQSGLLHALTLAPDKREELTERRTCPGPQFWLHATSSSCHGTGT